MGKVMLPYVEPMYSTYHFLSNAGIPAKQNETSDIWYYNSTVKWYCSREFLHGKTSPDLNLTCGNIWSVHFLEKSGVRTNMVRMCTVEIVKTILDDGCYVEFGGIDDYYIKGKTMYGQRHYYHDGLIVGYDDEKETFSIAAYDQRWIFTVFETPQECFAQAVNESCEQGAVGYLHAIKAKKDPILLKPEFIYGDLKAYLNSTVDGYSTDGSDRVWGIEVYNYLEMYLDNIIDGSIPRDQVDQRIFRLIWEHKKCMLGRIKAIEEYYEWDDSLSQMYEEVVTKSNQARMLYCKYTVDTFSRSLIRIQAILLKIKTLEIDVLTKLFDKLGNAIESAGE